MMRVFKNKNGFAALASTAIVSAVLLAMAAAAARSSFWERFAVFDRENKKISTALAESCANAVLLGLAEGKKVFPAEITVEGVKKCEIAQIGGSNPYVIITRASWKNSYTNLKVTAKLENDEFVINGWQEN